MTVIALLHLSAGNACCYSLVPEDRPGPGLAI